MKQRLLLTASLAVALSAAAQTAADSIPYANTIRVWPSDSPEVIVAKAAHVVPTPRQLAGLQNEFIAFIHIGPNTFTRREWGTGMEDPSIFALETLDTDQWAKAMKDAGMTMVVLTVKHHDGFVLYQTRYTDHGIMSTSFRDGKGDILADLSKSCAKYGLKLGVYLSPADLYQIESPDGLYGNLSPKTRRTIPRQVEGRPFENKTEFTFDSIDDYNEYFLNQLFELLTEYGPIHEVWFDGAHPKSKGGQTYNYAAWRELIRTLAPEAVIFGREDVRWGGNEAGDTRVAEFNVIPYADNPDLMVAFHDITGDDIGSREKLLGATYLHYQQPEIDTSIREGWFYRDDERQRTRSADDVFDIYERSVGGNCTFILNIPPNREGRFSPVDVAVLEEVGRRIRSTYDTDLLAGATTAPELLDGDIHTWVPASEAIEIVLPAEQTINRFMLQEPIADRGERIESVALDAWQDGAWQEIARGTNVGYKRILRFPNVITQRLRVRVLESRLEPYVANVSAHYYAERAPELSAQQALDGTVTLAPAKAPFSWHASKRSAQPALPDGAKVYYTTDGSAPTVASTLYEGPVALGPVELKAVCELNGEMGPVLTLQLGYPRQQWQVVEASSTADDHQPQLAIDSDANTYWLTDSADTARTIVIDLAAPTTINGVAYTPPTVFKGGMIAKAKVLVSDDGSNWREAGEWDFGNLVNDPTRRLFYLASPVSGRYLKIVATEIAIDAPQAAIANLELF
ncbi:MAG: alpha-L-fucosidase [Bacteroidales bacterium]|nr:alpha-L-fucosidase [Bacteroidales bacterium]